MPDCETCGENDADFTMSAESGGPEVHVCSIDAGFALVDLLANSRSVTVTQTIPKAQR